MHTPRLLLLTVIALGALVVGLTACGGGDTEASGTSGGEVTIGTGTDGTPVDDGEAADSGEAAATTAEDAGGETAAAAGEGDAAAGAGVWETAGCGGCHTLAAAGSAGNVGPNLDELKPSYDQVLTIVTNGRGAMPAFSGQLSEDDIKNVAAYVSQSAGQ
ncbi:MAG: c-type cytochrome [Actinomycetota bacterium]